MSLTMDNTLFIITQGQALTIARLAMSLDTKTLIKRIQVAKENPILDPFLHSKIGSERLDDLEVLVKALDEFKSKVQNALPRLGGLV